MIQNYVNMLIDYKPNQRLFTVNKTRLSRRLNTAAKKAGIDRIRVHGLRHSSASFLIKLGVTHYLFKRD